VDALHIHPDWLFSIFEMPAARYVQLDK